MCAETAYLSANALSSLPPSSVPSISPFLTRRRRLLRLLPKDHFVMSAALSHIFLGLARPKGAALALLLLLERRMSASQKPLLNVFCFPLSGKNNHRRSSSNGDKTLRPGPYIRYRVSRVWCHSGSEGGEVIDSRAADYKDNELSVDNHSLGRGERGSETELSVGRRTGCRVPGLRIRCQIRK